MTALSEKPFKRYLLTKPDGTTEFLNEVTFITRMMGFAKHMTTSQPYLRWAKSVGIPYPMTIETIEEQEYNTFDTAHLMRFMEFCKYKFEEI